MNTIKSICLVCEGYPAEGDPIFPFVEVLCKEFAKNDIRVTVICPQSITYCLKWKKKPHPWKRVDKVEEGLPIKVYQPYYLSFGNKNRHLNYRLRKFVVEWTYKILRLTPDICYAHFWYPGYTISKCAQKNGIPLFVATGEAELGDYEKEFHDDLNFMEYTTTIRGLISVSSENLTESLRMKLIDKNKSIVIPNAIDEKLFFPRNKNELRKKYGYRVEDFIVCFVGSFIDRKGSNRLSAAIDRLSDANIKSFFIGEGQGKYNLEPNCKGILKIGRVQREELPNYLSMADVFVLPTLSEGCCNAIIEALACGLPVISSDLPFNYDVLDETNSLLVDPNNIDAIANAIKELKDNHQKRKQLSEGALKRGRDLTIARRTQKILHFIESKLANL